jgi:predicted amidohydrolase
MGNTGPIDFIEGITDSFTFFLELYERLSSNRDIFNRIIRDSNLKNKEIRVSKDLSVILIGGICKIENQLAYGKIVDNYHHDNDFLALCIFKALGQYISTVLGEEAKSLDQLTYIEHGDLILIPRPKNYIFNHCDDLGFEPVFEPVNDDIGDGLPIVLRSFLNISIVKKVAHRITTVSRDILFETDKHLERRLQQGSFNIGLSCFYKEIDFQFGSLKKTYPATEKTPFWFEKVANPEATKACLLALLQEASSKMTGVLVLPELTMDYALLEVLKDWLRKNNSKDGILLTVAGSFHFNRNEELYNVSTILDFRGNILWSQAKRQWFSFNAKDMAGTGMQAKFKVSEHGGREMISVSEEIICADTALGRITICICLDFIHNDELPNLLKSGVNVYFVPAMTPANGHFITIADTLSTASLASTFFANSAFAANKDNTNGKIDKTGASFFRIPCKRSTATFANDDDLLIFKI